MERNSVSAAYIVAIIIIMMVVGFVQASAVFSGPITATVDVRSLQTNVQPTVIQRRTMVPSSSIFEALGAIVQWDEETRTSVVSYSATTDNVTVEPPKIPAGTVYDSQLENEIVQAYLFAYSLEERLWDQAEAFGTKEAVFQFMQQGFSDIFAWDLADYYWTEPDGLLGLGSYLIVPEYSIYVSEINMENNEATLWHETDQWERDHWGMEAYKIVTLQLDDGIWKVKNERSVGTSLT